MADEKKVGVVFDYFAKIKVAAIKLGAALKKGDTIHFKGHTTDFEQKVKSIQIEKESLESAKKGNSVGLKVKKRVRPNDTVYKVKQ